jgi:phage-related minor tail protein
MPSDIRLDAPEAARQQRQLETLDQLAKRFGSSLTQAFAANVSAGRRLETVLGSVGDALLRASERVAVKSVTSGIASLIRNAFAFGSEADPVALAQGGVIARGRVTPFAEGGVVAAPTYFPMARGLGLMGERGAEAVMPLARGPDGKLGVRAGAAGARAVTVTVYIATPDADSFRRSEAQVSAALARAVARGSRGL